MSFEKSIKHLKWRFSQDRITVSKKDIDALNEIIKTYNEMEKSTLDRNNLFIKLFIDNFLKQTSVAGRTSSEAMAEINKLLKIPVAEYYEKMKSEIPLLRFNVLVDKFNITPLYQVKDGKVRVNNSDDVIEKNEKNIKKNEKLLKEALTTEFSDQELKQFLDSTMFKMLLDRQNYR